MQRAPPRLVRAGLTASRPRTNGRERRAGTRGAAVERATLKLYLANVTAPGGARFELIVTDAGLLAIVAMAACPSAAGRAERLDFAPVNLRREGEDEKNLLNVC